MNLQPTATVLHVRGCPLGIRAVTQIAVAGSAVEHPTPLESVPRRPRAGRFATHAT